MHNPKVPDDFPRDPFPASLAGTQAKVAARRINGRCVVGLTDDERAERYAMCLDLVEQLVAYCRRKALEQPTRSPNELLDWVERGVRNKQAVWQLGGPEVDWIVAQMRWSYELTADAIDGSET
ncbi:hypothetical protein LMG31506_05784 [Cupriavidus yeoncheonensis]|uniref:Uncharacterized protein n=1 Tax=Cupriavidus yeoncheonensis TaxID=1462994 RepID=A0A916IYL8_9BURK|nr:hypothetical protein [Cupriavidus yeoncheonensis]CAG2156684.1 hypothetical protein LMG31506_05784 [Cupriavidus yeoncheonensis]